MPFNGEIKILIHIDFCQNCWNNSRSVQRISRFLIDCKKSQLFLQKIFEIEHAEYCCGFQFWNVLETASHHKQMRNSRCHNVVRPVDGKAKTGQSEYWGRQWQCRFFKQWVVCSLLFSISFSASPLPPLTFFVLAPLFKHSLISGRSPRGKEETTRSLGLQQNIQKFCCTHSSLGIMYNQAVIDRSIKEWYIPEHFCFGSSHCVLVHLLSISCNPAVVNTDWIELNWY